MPYKDEETQKRYQQDWYLRKKNGKETKLFPNRILTSEERGKKSKVWKKNSRQKLVKWKREVINKRLGDSCCLCGRTISLILHKKDGKAHRNLDCLGRKEFEKEISSGDYVIVCYGCHKGVHWAYKFLGLTWEQIIRAIKAP